MDFCESDCIGVGLDKFYCTYQNWDFFSDFHHVGSCSIVRNCLCADEGGHNRQGKGDKNTAKLDRETEELHHDHVGMEVSKLIQYGRGEKKLTQKDLATVRGGYN